MADLSIHPALDALRFNEKVNDHLDGKVRKLLERMDTISKQFDDVTALSNEFNLRTNFDEKGVTFIDFTNTEFQELIDRLYDSGVLKEENGQRKYKFETKKEIEMFKAKLDGIANQLKNKNQEPLILIQPLLNLLELMNRIGKTILELDEKLKEKTNANIR